MQEHCLSFQAPSKANADKSFRESWLVFKAEGLSETSPMIIHVAGKSTFRDWLLGRRAASESLEKSLCAAESVPCKFTAPGSQDAKGKT